GSDDRESKSMCLWANELRVTDFDSQKGWAANARMSMQLADLGTFSASTRYTSFGFGSIQDKISQRTRFATFEYDLSASINVDKFLLPEKTGLKVPMFASYQQSRSTPQYDPLDPDTPLDAALNSFATEQERDDYRRIVEDRRTNRSLNFTNVRKEKVNPDARSNIYDIENFSFTYAYSDSRSSNVNQQSFLQKTVSGGVAYNYSPPTVSIEPFANSQAFSSPFLKLIKDINFSPLPSNLSFRADLNRSFRRTQLYDDDLSIPGPGEPNDLLLIERLFTFSRSYSFRWSLFKGLSVDYRARANAVIDEPEPEIVGDIDTPDERKFIWDQIWSLGRMRNFNQEISAQYKLPLDKLPITSWMNADYRYAVTYGWTAGFVNRERDEAGDLEPDPDDPNFFGNFINNSRDQTLSGRLDFVKLYNNIPALKRANAPPRNSRSSTSRSRANSRTNEAEASTGGGQNFGNALLRLLMSLRSANLTYGIREGTTLPGFLPSPFLFGLDSGFSTPGWGFVLGSQDAGIRTRAADNGWLTLNPQLTAPFEQIRSVDLTMSAAVEPTNDIKIKVDATRSQTANFQELFRYNAADSVLAFQSLTPTRGGSYNLTFLSIGTAFERQPMNVSPAFEQFVENIDIMRQRINERVANEGIIGEYDTLSQDILIPAFLSAYAGSDARTASTNPFPRIPLPNWRLDYAGLGNLPGLRDVFSSINITHSYRSVYSVSNYINQPRYQEGIGLENSILDYPLASVVDETSGNLVPFYIISQVSIAEQFAPLIGINVRTRSNLTTRLEYKRDRTLSLNLSNAQVNETQGSEISFDFGFTKDNFKLPFKSRGRTIVLKNDVTMRMNFSIRDTKVIQRTLDGENTITNGNLNFQMRPTVSYRLNNQLDLTFYFDRSVNDPLAGSFRRATTSFGIQTRLSFAQ
ncbi:MAG: cell surface protein SprA, partial [Bacteroidota bacterium]